MRIVLVGPPGAGKGTQAGRIVDRFGGVHIATGDILRSNADRGTELGRTASRYMDRGELVPDEVIIDMVLERLGEEDCAGGFVLDGFPRTVPQAEALGKRLDELGRPLDVVVSLEAGEDELRRRLAARAEKQDRAEDDDEGAIRRRLELFDRETEPLLDFYDGQGLLVGDRADRRRPRRPRRPGGGLIALVTGASSGIGAAVARRLAAEPGARLVLVARRRERLEALAAELGGATVIAADLLEEATPALVARRVATDHGRLDLLVNNAGVGGRGSFAGGGWAEVRRAMAINFDAQVRLTEALLPLLRRSAPSGVVNVGSVAGRVSRPGAGSYSASKFALAGWTEALQMEERRHGVHVALVQLGFVATEGFPQRKLLARPWTRWMVSTDAKAAEGIVDAWRRRRPEAYVPRPYGLVPVARVLLPGLYRRAVGGGAFTASTRS
jgi:short-subunit dehydrogenase/adenylate kinase family enzyme